MSKWIGVELGCRDTHHEYRDYQPLGVKKIFTVIIA